MRECCISCSGPCSATSISSAYGGMLGGALMFFLCGERSWRGPLLAKPEGGVPCLTTRNTAPASAVIDDEVGSLKPLSSTSGSWRERAVILAAVVFQVVVLAMMITRNTVPFIGGQTVLLRVVPVDPPRPHAWGLRDSQL